MNDIISIDESSFDSNISNDIGWGIKGPKLYGTINALQKRYTVMTAISNKKVIANKIIKNSANSLDFLNFLKDDLKNITNKYLLLDGARIHHAKVVTEYMKVSSNEFIYNIAYNPETNPKSIFND